jgi:superfamily II DNA or RNA helicase
MGAVSEWEREYNLEEARQKPSGRAEAAHQTEALSVLSKWYASGSTVDAGGLLVLPTGAGKTFTAVRFLCRNPLSDGYKVLWLAHTHHLLEQALDSFGKRSDGASLEVGHIREPRERLRARVVSGTDGHSRISAVSQHDDVVIATLQTAARAYREGHAQFRSFLESANGKLLVVFDEAHHAPAPSYTEFLLALRREIPGMKLMGLTATPMYNDAKREGWLTRLFPQKILFQVSAARLIAQGILAKPIAIPCNTRFEPKFDEAQFQRWRATHQDVPEGIVSQLASNQERNDAICRTYVDRRVEFGKTIIFADRWYQCEYLCRKLEENGVRAGAMYSQVEQGPGSVEERNRRSRDANALVLKAFHDGELDVLINVRMLTEGTDVPSVQTVFLTRQTTSPILLRQMVGRALRGPKFGGTATANIVLFMDQWREAIQWAEFDDFWEGEATQQARQPRRELPLQLVSIELIRRLARQMESGLIAPASFLELLPVGWFVAEFDVEVPETDDTEHARPMIMVHQEEKENFDALLAHMRESDLRAFADPGVRYETVSVQLDEWGRAFFKSAERDARGIGMSLFHLARHVGQAGGEAPPFFPFEHREAHDLTSLAAQAANEDWGPSQTAKLLGAVYGDERKFWRAMFPTFALFRDQFRHLVDGQLQRSTGIGVVDFSPSVISPPTMLPDAEPSESVKREVLRRDGYRCLCCDSDNTRKLQIDHILSRYHGGGNEPSNLQTLCSICNSDKSIREMHFRTTVTLLSAVPPLAFPSGYVSADRERLERDVRRTVNMFYRCAAVDHIETGVRGLARREWHINLRAGNPREWLESHAKELFERIRSAQADVEASRIRRLVIRASGDDELGRAEYRYQPNILPDTRPLKPRDMKPRSAVAVYAPDIEDFPNEPVQGKIIRVDPRRKVADVRVQRGRKTEEVEGIPFSSIFHWDALSAVEMESEEG